MKRAQDLARRMVTEWGMGDHSLGIDRDSKSAATQDAIDAQVADMIDGAYTRACSVLNEHRDALQRLVRLLIEEESVQGDRVRALVEPPSPPR